MSRQPGIKTNYSRSKVLVISIIGVALTLSVVFILFTNSVLDLTQKESTPTPLPSIELTPNPTTTYLSPITTKTPRPTIPTPTPLPTLTKEELDTLINTFEDYNFDIPDEALEEIRRGGQSG